ncbi:MAG: hypothetical protein M1825_000086 [Sarcosagium campestre]|nr:MAG: hypothetical protein M1825_000086 [Sarcosagium campestre]
MSSGLISGIFHQALNARQLTSIDMGETKFVRFGPDQSKCVGTQGLAGCTVALIVSPYAVIMSHIPPTLNVNDFMSKIEGFYSHHRETFPSVSGTMVGAGYNRVLLVGHHAAVIEARFQRLGITPFVRTYNPNPLSAEFAGRGTVVVDSRGQTINVYVEDTLVECLRK